MNESYSIFVVVVVINGTDEINKQEYDIVEALLDALLELVEVGNRDALLRKESDSRLDSVRQVRDLVEGILVGDLLVHEHQALQSLSLLREHSFLEFDRDVLEDDKPKRSTKQAVEQP